MPKSGVFRKTVNSKSEKIKKKLFNALLLFSLILFVASAIQTNGKIKKINKEVEDREDKLAELKKEEEQMQKKYDEVTSQEYMEKQLRNQLNLSKENEIILVLPEDEILKKLVPKDEVEDQIAITPNYIKWAKLFAVLK